MLCTCVLGPAAAAAGHMHETESQSPSDESDASIQPLIPTAAGSQAERSADPKPEPEPGSGLTSAKASAVTQSKPLTRSTTKAPPIPVSRHRPFGPWTNDTWPAFYDREGFAASLRSHYGDVIGADRCAGAGETCECKGGGTVHFGQMGRWLSKKLVPTFRGGPPRTGGIECTAQAMGGDPCPGYNKGCWCTAPDDRRALWPGSPPRAGSQGQASALLPARPAIGGPGHHAALRFNPRAGSALLNMTCLCRRLKLPPPVLRPANGAVEFLCSAPDFRQNVIATWEDLITEGERAVTDRAREALRGARHWHWHSSYPRKAPSVSVAPVFSAETVVCWKKMELRTSGRLSSCLAPRFSRFWR